MAQTRAFLSAAKALLVEAELKKMVAVLREYKDKRISSAEAVGRLAPLLRGKGDLLQRFAQFVPENERMEYLEMVEKARVAAAGAEVDAVATAKERCVWECCGGGRGGDCKRGAFGNGRTGAILQLESIDDRFFLLVQASKYASTLLPNRRSREDGCACLVDDSEIAMDDGEGTFHFAGSGETWRQWVASLWGRSSTQIPKSPTRKVLATMAGTRRTLALDLVRGWAWAEGRLGRDLVRGWAWAEGWLTVPRTPHQDWLGLVH